MNLHDIDNSSWPYGLEKPTYLEIAGHGVIRTSFKSSDLETMCIYRLIYCLDSAYKQNGRLTLLSNKPLIKKNFHN